MTLKTSDISKSMLRNNADVRQCSYFEFGLLVVPKAKVECHSMPVGVRERRPGISKF